MKVYYAKEQNDDNWFKALTRNQVEAAIVHVRTINEPLLHKIVTSFNAGLKVVIRYDVDIWGGGHTFRREPLLRIKSCLEGLSALNHAGIPSYAIILNIINITPNAEDLETLKSFLSEAEERGYLGRYAVRASVLETPAKVVRALEEAKIVPPYGKHVLPSFEDYTAICKYMGWYDTSYEIVDATFLERCQEEFCACEFVQDANLLDLARNRVAVEIGNMEYITL